jgi:hypothetical protein
MRNENDVSHQPHPVQQKQLALFAGVLLAVLMAGTGGYLLGMRNSQSISPSQPSPTITAQTSMSTPSPISTQAIAAMNWKTYTNAQWGLSFKYPETWFPQEVPKSSQRGDSIDFYLYGVTPHPGGEGDPSNAVFTVESQEGHNQQTNEQFISEARQTGGKRVLNVAGKPAIRGDGYRGEWYYAIKLSSTRLLILAAINEDGANRLDTIASTINFTNE